MAENRIGRSATEQLMRFVPEGAPDFVVAGPDYPSEVQGVKQYYAGRCKAMTTSQTQEIPQCSSRPTIRMSKDHESTFSIVGLAAHVNIDEISKGDMADSTKKPSDVYPACAVCEEYATKRCERCHQVRYCSSHCQKSHWLTPGPGGHKEKCQDITMYKKYFYVGQDKYGNLGIFAGMDIPKGQRIAFFDYDVKRWHLHACLRFSPETKKMHITNEDYFKSFRRPNPHFDHSMYLWPDIDLINGTSLATGYVLVGRPYNPEPSPTSSPLAAGHLINDAMKPDFRDANKLTQITTLKRELKRYRVITSLHRNVEIDEGFWFCATRNIVAGEEIVTAYGEEFWLHHHLMNARIPPERLLMFTYMCLYAKREGLKPPYDPFRCREYETETNYMFLKHLCGYTEAEIFSGKYKDPEEFILMVLEAVHCELICTDDVDVDSEQAKVLEALEQAANSKRRYEAAKKRKQKKDENRSKKS